MQPEEQPAAQPPAGQPQQPATPPGQPNPPPAQPPQPGQVPPGYPPPGYAAPPQPPGYGTQQPPPGYGYPPGQQPPPGYGYPAGQQPPPGYGYAPQGYAVRPAYVPPAPYHVPPTDGRPPEFAPPATGTLLQAWRSLATKPSRQNYVAWAQAAKPGWVRNSVITAVVFYVVYALALFGGIFGVILSTFASYGTNSAVPSTFTLFFGFLVLFVPITYVANFFAVPFGQALFMSSSLGTVRQRYDRALKPWALAQVPLSVVTAIGGLLGLGIFALIYAISPHSNVDDAAGAIFVGFFLSILVLIPASIYALIQQLQSGSVGSGMIRWAVFGINLLTSVVLSFALNLILQPLAILIFSSLLRGVSTTTGFLPFH